MATSGNTLEYEGNFTGDDTARIPVSCQRPTVGAECKNPNGPDSPPGGNLTPWTVRKLQRMIYICDPCSTYMAQKETSVTRIRGTTSTIGGFPLNVALARTAAMVDPAAIAAGTNASQRGSILRPPVVAMRPHTFQTTPFSPVASSFASTSSPATFSQSGQSFRNPSLSPTKPSISGYSSGHSHYLARRDAQARRASAAIPPSQLHDETYTLNVSVKCHDNGRSRFIFNIQSFGVPFVDAHSTGPQLRLVVTKALAEPWNKATFYFPLLNDMWKLQDKSDVDLVASFPNSAVFYAACLSQLASGKTRFNHRKTMHAVVMLTAEAEAEVEVHRQEIMAAREDPNLPGEFSASISPSKLKTQSPIKKQMISSLAAGSTTHSTGYIPSTWTQTRLATSTQAKHSSAIVEPTTPQKSSKKRSLVISPSSTAAKSPPTKRIASGGAASPVTWSDLVNAVKPEKLGEALRIHGADIKPNGMDCSRTFSVHFFQVEHLTLDRVMTNLPLDFGDSRLAFAGSIIYNLNINNELGCGSFKKCFLGRLILMAPPPSGLGSVGSSVVAIKRPYLKNFNDSGTSTSAPRSTRFPPSDELCFITKEAVLWQWANALHGVTETFIRDHPKANQEGAPIAPSVRFVEAGVAKFIGNNAGGDSALSGAALLEEQIPKEQGFLCYLGNGSAVPAFFPSGTYEYTLAQFCAFSQHVQWVVTGRQVYCSDWQGGSSGSVDIQSLLTDPQIMCSP
ncbi:hypothetical protein FRC09_011925 [Ceratobasidium sp. 395]|nr:hypothetical protein FRC09_011925 [Ceratobasidium sp. 395]